MTEHSNQRQVDLLAILIQQCADVQARAADVIRCGLDAVQPGHDQANGDRLSHELGDLIHLVDVLTNEGMAVDNGIETGIARMKAHLLRTLPASPPIVPTEIALFDGDVTLLRAARGGMSYQAMPLTLKRSIDRLIEASLLTRSDMDPDIVALTERGRLALAEERS